MRGKEFLELAREIIAGGRERHNRGAAGRAYYALMLECREALFRWGFKIPPRENVHSFVRLRFIYSGNVDVTRIGRVLEELGQLRNKADYALATLAVFATAARAQTAVQECADSITLLDAIETDPARRSTAIAAISKAFP